MTSPSVRRASLTFASPPDFESSQGSGLDSNEYLVTVQARDDAFNSSSLDVTVTVTDVNEGPEVTGSVSLTFTENVEMDRVLATYTAGTPRTHPPTSPVGPSQALMQATSPSTRTESSPSGTYPTMRGLRTRGATTCTTSRYGPQTEASTVTWG